MEVIILTDFIPRIPLILTSIAITSETFIFYYDQVRRYSLLVHRSGFTKRHASRTVNFILFPQFGFT